MKRNLFGECSSCELVKGGFETLALLIWMIFGLHFRGILFSRFGVTLLSDMHAFYWLLLVNMLDTMSENLERLWLGLEVIDPDLKRSPFAKFQPHVSSVRVVIEKNKKTISLPIFPIY